VGWLEKLDALSKRVSPEERRELEAALEVRISKPSSEEIRSYHRAQQAGMPVICVNEYTA